MSAAAVIVLTAKSISASFASDESFHATAAVTILHEHVLPVTFPEFYSGFYYYYQPLFHIVGAMWAGLFGVTALHALPPALFAGLLALLLARPLGRGSAVAGAWAAMLCVSNRSLARYAVRLYAEGLVTLLFLAAVLLLLWFGRSSSRKVAVALGVVTGCALLAKFNAWILLAPITAGAVAAQRSGKPHRARSLWIAVAIAVALASLHLVRNQVLYGSAFYPAFAPDLDRQLYALNSAHFSIPLASFYATLPRTLGIPLLLMVGSAVIVSIRRRRAGWLEALLAFGVLGMLVIPLSAYAAERHVNPCIPLIALTSSAIVASALARQRWTWLAISTALMVVAVIALGRYGNLRGDVDNPPFLARAFHEIGPHLPPNALVLSLWTYDTAYYTGRRATWPIPWGQKDRPKEMFETGDPERILAALRAHGVDYVLTPVRSKDRDFNSANYPARFVNGMDSLYRAGRVQRIWSSNEICLIQVPPK
jgi:4-amino-4-deoxy-L-arabinose transferase-like glycosyltransferase